jgi:hypothetical protein
MLIVKVVAIEIEIKITVVGTIYVAVREITVDMTEATRGKTGVEMIGTMIGRTRITVGAVIVIGTTIVIMAARREAKIPKEVEKAKTAGRVVVKVQVRVVVKERIGVVMTVLMMRLSK